ncbi:hypothetical protein BI364_12495 [Acidihalobacter yilgarnensis]|uniref:Uncharacterized protein n=1 Tax=Acidihalobacter yilgarnensis TaxID=2819280 RepID=A0A1D8IQD8_9GAMM|nr:hypothetical protein [Acidihalobacter yilgarnensis]AOU98671.1 hypothetical protein BI364_12495 [Acidihalobacter yilgarnensis]
MAQNQTTARAAGKPKAPARSAKAKPLGSLPGSAKAKPAATPGIHAKRKPESGCLLAERLRGKASREGVWWQRKASRCCGDWR